ncbi:hypothetical protein ELE36_13010 [Pseudolysobacter antarcticus]|uniref:Blue (type 1) copper domain-containing protein n=1 Tax=Pseudolysobacter antarcticus TaxID=2511995 RepID=A0A411HLE9_9GAMM|nr:plastocyanin/azurin family copper-binding protein [Pseudolysobacter antarcticus]QBB71197.1 hypothetical protein ELE36_13010 [Pseudolysobacter antarcticus]
MDAPILVLRRQVSAYRCYRFYLSTFLRFHLEIHMRIRNGRLSLAILLLTTLPAWGANNFVVIVGQNISGNPALAFNPPSLPVAPGDTITFKNVGGGMHNAHSVDSSFAFQCGAGDCTSGAAVSGPWISPAITVPGNASGKTIAYLCDLHGVAMSGQIVVSGSTPVTLQSFEVE